MSAIDDIIDIVDQHDRFMISTHVRSDGDAIGSEVAALQVLRSLGKSAEIVNDGAVPRVFQFLDPNGEIAGDPATARGDAQVAFVLDATSLDRIGDAAKRIPDGATIINVDHHVSNENFGAVNLVDPHACSTGEIVYRIIKQAGVSVPQLGLEAIYTAIVTDTGRFTHGNTTPEALHAAADLIHAGVDPGKMGSQIYQNEPVGLSLLRSQTGATLELHEDGQIATMHMTRQMFAETGVDPMDTQEFSDMPRALEGVEVGVLFRELDEPNKVKASFRSKGRVDVNAIAGSFDGGGHIRAAGCTVDGDLATGKAKIVAAVTEALKRS